MGKPFKLGHILTQENLLASEKLLQDEAKAEGGTPQQYNAFIAETEKKGIQERKELIKQAEEGDLQDGSDVLEDEGSPEEVQDTELLDAVQEDTEEEQQVSTEALDTWIKEKTQGSDSKIVRGLGELTAGLTHLGIKYGPGLLNAMYKGTIWTFSRIGSTVFTATEKLQEYLEKSRNSIDKLESRLSAAERVIVDKLNEDIQVPSFTYKNQVVLNQLLAAGSMDVAGNLRQYADHLGTVTESIANEFEAGNAAVNRLVNSSAKAEVVDFSAFMNVDAPKKGFRKGGPNGYQVKSIGSELWSTSDPWPGGGTLIFIRPTPSKEMQSIISGYKAADMYVAPAPKGDKSRQQTKSFSSTDLLLIAKSAKMLISATKRVSKTQEKMKSMEEDYLNVAKRLFYSLADEKAKDGNRANVADMLYLRANLSSTVFVKGSTACQTYASRVLSAAVQLLEDHAKRLVTGN